MKHRNDIFDKTYSDTRYRIALHLFFWLLLFAGYAYYSNISFNPVSKTPATYLLALKSTVILAVAFYVLMYAVWPRYLAKRKWLKSIVLLFVWMVTIASLDAWGDLLVFGNCPSCMESLSVYSPDYYHFLQRNFSNIVLVRVLSGGFLYQLVFQLSVPIAMKIGRSYFRQTVQGLQLAKDNLQLEFNFLKSQVNPHFLFNTLNNIYSLVVNEKKDQAAETLSRLSGFLRYTLYETGDEKIALEKEVHLLKDYIELETLRLNETGVQFQYETDRDDYTVPPLLFMPALENAFKYTEDQNNNTIAVSIKAKEKKLQVTIQNSIGHAKNGATGGIGLQNLQKRVQHYYPGKSSYSASAANGVYLFQLSCALA